MFFFHHCFIVFFPIFRHNFYIKSKKKNVQKWTRPETPPPHCGLSPSKCFFFFFLLPLWLFLDFYFRGSFFSLIFENVFTKGIPTFGRVCLSITFYLFAHSCFGIFWKFRGFFLVWFLSFVNSIIVLVWILSFEKL